jgi:iron complex outermembrane receptor protein
MIVTKNRCGLKFGLLLSSAGICVALPVHAQVAQQPSAANADVELEDIVVTAQKRAERLEDVPIAITSVSGDALAQSGITAVSQLQQAVPALRVDYGGAFAQPSIRGVGSALAGVGFNSNIATYIDGFYQPSTLSTDFDLLSVSNVSVLKGPQGTLFGRNATGGAILVTTENPSFDPSMVASVSYARFDDRKISFFGTTGLTEKIAVNLAASYEKGDGYIKNVITGGNAAPIKRYSIRARGLLNLSEGNRLILTYTHSYVSDATQVLFFPKPGTSLAEDFAGGAKSRPFRSVETSPTDFHVRVDAVTLKGEFDIGFADLASYSMFRHQRAYNEFAIDGSNLDIFANRYIPRDTTYTQEFNLTSKPGSSLSWVLGAFYYHDREKGPFDIALGSAPEGPGYYPDQSSRAVAVFGDATLDVGNKIFVTGGLRYNVEKRIGRYETFSPVVGPIGSDKNSATFRSATPRVVVRWEPADRTSVYASYSRGFKSGLFNVNGQNVKDFVPPEKIDAFEVGYKTVTSGGIRFNASAFYYNYSNLQVASYSGTASFVRAAGKARIYGGEVELVAPVTSQLTFKAAGAYTHAKYRKFDGAPFQTRCVDPSCGAAFGLFLASPVSAAGNDVQRAPRVTGTFAVDYKLPLAGGSRINLHGDVYYTSKFFFDPVEQYGQGRYALLNLRATWSSANDRFSVAAFGNNVTNKRYLTQGLPLPFMIAQTYGSPATYGVSATVRY